MDRLRFSGRQSDGSFGRQLKSLRSAQKRTQAVLAMEAGTSSRHLSFIETGRANPSLGLALRLADALGLNASGRDAFLAGAGYAPELTVSDPPLDPPLDPVLHLAQDMVANCHIFPALATDGYFNVLAANEPACLIFPELGQESSNKNFLQMLVEPGPVRSSLQNWPEIAQFLIHWLHRYRKVYARDVAFHNFSYKLEDQLGIKNVSGVWSWQPYCKLVVEHQGNILSLACVSVDVGPGNTELASDETIVGLSFDNFVPLDEMTHMFFQKPSQKSAKPSLIKTAG